MGIVRILVTHWNLRKVSHHRPAANRPVKITVDVNISATVGTLVNASYWTQENVPAISCGGPRSPLLQTVKVFI